MLQAIRLQLEQEALQVHPHKVLQVQIQFFQQLLQQVEVEVVIDKDQHQVQTQMEQQVVLVEEVEVLDQLQA